MIQSVVDELPLNVSQILGLDHQANLLGDVIEIDKLNIQVNQSPPEILYNVIRKFALWCMEKNKLSRYLCIILVNISKSLKEINL